MFELHEAAKKLNSNKVRELIQQGSDVNEYDDQGKTPLHALIIEHLVFGDSSNEQEVIEILDILIEAGANINAKEKEGQQRTILHWAAEAKEPALTKALLERKANVHALTWFKATPLHLAVDDHSVKAPYEMQNETVELLLQKGASINAVNGAGMRPTTTSSVSENPDLHKLLLKYGVPSAEKTDAEKFLEGISTDFSSLFFKPEHKKIYNPKSLKELASEKAIKIRYSKEMPSNYYKNLLKLPYDVRATFPELEFDPKKLFISKISKLVDNHVEFLNKKNNGKSSEEREFLDRIESALKEESPYNAIHKLKQELDERIKKGFFSTFKSNMEPLRDQIVTVMREYGTDKALYAKYAPKTSKASNVPNIPNAPEKPTPAELFIDRVNKAVKDHIEFLNKKNNNNNSGERNFLAKIKEAIKEQIPYNAIYKLKQELDEKIKEGFLSTFKDNMSPFRDQIVQIMRQYGADKEVYAKNVTTVPTLKK